MDTSAMLQLNEQQQAAAQAHRSAAVISSAGTGKTAMLTQRYLNHVLGGLSPLQVVAVTFTEAAAHELRGRVRAALRHSPLTTPAALAELELSPIGTIHSLCARICREHPEEAEVPASFQILDQAAAAIFAAEQREGLLASLPHDLFLGEAGIPLGQAERILPHLLEAPHLTAEALAVMAQPWNELREAWEEAAATLRTAARARLCNDEWHHSAALLRGLTCSDASDALYPQWQTIVAQLEAIERAADPGEAVAALAEARLSGGGKAANWSAPPAEVRAACKFLRDAAEKARKDGLIDLRIGPDDEQLYAKVATLRSIFERASATMAGIKRRAGVLDFADLELGALRALEHEGVREWYRQRWQVLLLDEAQDINRTQAVILERLATLAPDNLVCAVGDEKQAIYGFRGADVEEFRRFRDEVVVGRLGGQVIDLDQTYRQ
ncbi:MAG: UvrD-helicase domain-containing protein, partial [Armatimonadetes bacterium]|nr:UvrD-helicase domain-containing protein [Armatimonadota bacterium]